MARPARPKRKAGGCLLILLFLIVLAAVAAFGGLVLLAARQPVGLPLAVQLGAPLTGAQAELNYPLLVEAWAASQAGVTRLELYADGVLAGVQTSSLPTGSNPLLYQLPWIPLTTGRHALVVRAYDNDGRLADSTIVYVNVVPLLAATASIDPDSLALEPGQSPPSLNAVAEGLGLPLTQLLALNPALVGTDLAARLPAGQPLILPRGPLSPPPVVPAPDPLIGSPPAPAGLTVALDCTAGQIAWDGALGVTHYAIYRFAPGAVSAHRQEVRGVNALTDSLPVLGEYRYQVASLADGLETLSPMVDASTPATCLPPARPPDTVEVHLAALSLETDAPFEGVYCYLSVNGSPFERVPSADFSVLLPSAGGLHYDLAAQLPQHGEFILAAQPSAGPVHLAGECWGRAGALSLPLGAFVADDPPAKWNGAALLARSAPAALTLGQSGGLAHTSALARAGAFRLTYTLTAVQPEAATRGAVPWLVEAYGLPAPQNLRLENSTLACRELSQSSSQPGSYVRPGGPRDTGTNPATWLTEALRASLTEQTLCMTAAAFGGWPTLLWDWHDDTGVFTEAMLDGYHVSVRATDTIRQPEDYSLFLPVGRPSGATGGPSASADRNPSFWQRDIRPGTLRASLARLTNLPCSLRYDFTVSAVYGSYQSAPSDALSFETEPCSGTAQITVDFETLVVGPVADLGDLCPFACTPASLEVVGHLFAGAGVSYLPRRWYSYPGPDHSLLSPAGSPPFPSFGHAWTPNQISPVLQGRYAWATQWLGDVIAGRSPRVEQQRQAWRIVVRPSGTIPLGTRLDDLDGSGAQPFCHTDYELAARHATAWYNFDETVTLRDTRGEASCEITVHIVGSRYP